jgi:hypothetical protein
MFALMYRCRALVAVVGATAVGICAITALPGAERDLALTTAAAGAPGCSGSQNPFIGANPMSDRREDVTPVTQTADAR